MSEGVSKVSERASEWAQRRARAKRAVQSKRTSERCKRTDKRVTQYSNLYSWLLSTIVVTRLKRETRDVSLCAEEFPCLRANHATHTGLLFLHLSIVYSHADCCCFSIHSMFSVMKIIFPSVKYFLSRKSLFFPLIVCRQSRLSFHLFIVCSCFGCNSEEFF